MRAPNLPPRSWSTTEDAFVRNAYLAGEDIAVIAHGVKATSGEIVTRLFALGVMQHRRSAPKDARQRAPKPTIPRPEPLPKPAPEDSSHRILRMFRDQRMDTKAIALTLGLREHEVARLLSAARDHARQQPAMEPAS